LRSTLISEREQELTQRRKSHSGFWMLAFR